MRVARTGRVALITLLVVMLLGGSASGLAVPIPTVSWTLTGLAVSDVAQEYNPALDGKLVAWEVEGQIRVKNLQTGEYRWIPDSGGTQQNPDVSGDRVVFEDDASGSWDIRMYHWSTNTVSEVCNTPDIENSPRIDGNYVVWYNATTHYIWGRDDDIGGYTARQHTFGPLLDCYRFDVDNGRLIAFNPLNSQVWMKVLRPEYWVPLYDFPGSGYTARLHGDRLVIETYDGDWDVYSYDIPSRVMTNLATSDTMDEEYPSIFHNTVAWEETPPSEDSNIGYEWIGDAYPINTPGFGDPVEWESRPSVYGHRIAYTRSRPNLDVMLATSNTKLASRTQGSNRYGTAAAISASYFSDAHDVVLCNGLNFPDALSAAPFAKALNAPLLLTAPATLSAETAAEIARLAPTKVWIIGGSDVVSNAIYDQLDVTYEVERIAGADRYETSAAIARKLKAVFGPSLTVFRAFYARGDAFPDALAVGPVAGAALGPVMLVKPTSVPASIASAVNDLDLTVGYVIGGEDVVSPAVFDAIKALGIANGGAGVIERWSGANRYATAAAVANKGLENRWIDLDTCGFAIGTNFPDALGGGAALGHYGSALLLTSGTSLSVATGAFLDAHRYEIGRTDAFGGSDVFTDATYNAIKAKIY